MKKILVSILAISFLFGQANAESNFRVSSNDSSGLVFDWEASDGSEMYRIDYGKASWIVDDSVDFLSDTTYTFTDLEDNTSYYFSLVWYDEWGNQAFKSNELMATTLEWLGESSNATDEALWLFFVEESRMIGENEIELTFSNPVKQEESENRKFKVEWVNNPNDYFEVLDSFVKESNNNTLILTLDWIPQEWEEYKVIVLSTKDINDQNIEFWVDSETVFEWLSIDDIQYEVNEDNLSLNSAWDEASNVWVEVNSEDIDNNVINVAQSNDRLPQTWPAQTLLVLMSLLFWTLIFYNRFKK